MKWSWYWKLDSQNHENLLSSVSMLPEKEGWGVWSESYLNEKFQNLCAWEILIQTWFSQLLGKSQFAGEREITRLQGLNHFPIHSPSDFKIIILPSGSKLWPSILYVDPWLLTIHLRMEKRSNFSFTVYACLCNPIWLLCALFIITIKVYRGDSDKAQDTIIGFYNEFYTVAMKSTILQFATEKVIAII